MKRWFTVLIALAAALALCGAALALTADTRTALRSSLGQGMITASVIGLLLCAVLRPKAAKADAVQAGSGAVSAGERSQCSFADVAANAEARESLAQLCDYLKNPEKYARYGARMPRGVLLYGPPGTGKTLLARALAGEADVPFFALSGSDFVEKYVGVGASRIRDLVKRARAATTVPRTSGIRR